MKKRPLIMLSNDDGIDSPGLHASVEAIEDMAEAIIAAPDRQQTATGRSLIQHNPKATFQERQVPLKNKTITGYCLEASPAICVRHGLQCLCDGRKPNLVISGINFGENIGTDVTASGTVGAAIQAISDGVKKAIAVSMEVPYEYHHSTSQLDFSQATQIVRQAVELLLEPEWPEDVHIIKIDIPGSATPETPWILCRQSLQPGWYGHIENGNPHTPLDACTGHRGPYPGSNYQNGDDMEVLYEKKAIAITPLSIDLTSRIPMKTLSDLLPPLPG